MEAVRVILLKYMYRTYAAGGERPNGMGRLNECAFSRFRDALERCKAVTRQSGEMGAQSEDVCGEVRTACRGSKASQT